MLYRAWSGDVSHQRESCEYSTSGCTGTEKVIRYSRDCLSLKAFARGTSAEPLTPTGPSTEAPQSLTLPVHMPPSHQRLVCPRHPESLRELLLHVPEDRSTCSPPHTTEIPTAQPEATRGTPEHLAVCVGGAVGWSLRAGGPAVNGTREGTQTLTNLGKLLQETTIEESGLLLSAVEWGWLRYFLRSTGVEEIQDSIYEVFHIEEELMERLPKGQWHK
ncbi:hypothetical protein Anapl_06825 [Anas platyrhynchos]|uniref:Uncharacterized protein n=1 Tax=Anas platyrhynchos TaxID=8839 RepID=R0M4M4_ANAPL|nr:hypothetical protein Anapl_06825 [Anas platyrhynchos]